MFEKITDKVMGRIHISQNDSSYFNYYTKISNAVIEGLYKRDDINDRNKRKYKIRIPDNDDINALVYIDGEYDIIEINKGTILKIHDVFLHLCEDREFYSGIGNVELCRKATFINPEIINHKIIFRTGVKDEGRQKLAFDLSSCAIFFIIYHEIGHHFNGHMFYSGNRSSFFYPEPLDNVQEQTIEMDADMFATALLVQSLDIIFQDYPAQNRINMFFSSVTILFIIIENGFSMERHNGNYLPNFYRLKRILLDFLSNVDMNRDMKKNYINNFCSELKSSKDVYENVFNRKFDELFEIDFSEDVDEYYNKVILEEWRKIRKCLITYSKIPLPK